MGRHTEELEAEISINKDHMDSYFIYGISKQTSRIKDI